MDEMYCIFSQKKFCQTFLIFCLAFIAIFDKLSLTQSDMTQSAGTVEYTDCTSAEG